MSHPTPIARRIARRRQIWTGVFALWIATGLGFILGRVTRPAQASAIPLQEVAPERLARWIQLSEVERRDFRRLYRRFLRHDTEKRELIRGVAQKYAGLPEEQREVVIGWLERFEALSRRDRQALQPVLRRHQRRFLEGSSRPWVRFQELRRLSPIERRRRLARQERWSQLSEVQRRLFEQVIFGNDL